jgi:hypothetical protein
MSADTILDDLFLSCALVAFVERARVEQRWPDSEATRLRAYQLYEAALAEKNRRPAAPNVGSHTPLVAPKPAPDSHN